MTNINQINETAQSFAALNPKVSKSKGAEAFETALGKALDKKGASEMETLPANALRELASAEFNIMKISDIVSGKTGTLLELLDAYSSKLENTDISLKSIAPVLEEIKTTSGSLLKETLRLTDADTNLKNIATQAIVTAQTEYLKFQRGDYLS